MSESELIYVTYQTFPSEKANTIQTIENLKYLSKNNLAGLTRNQKRI